MFGVDLTGPRVSETMVGAVDLPSVPSLVPQSFGHTDPGAGSQSYHVLASGTGVALAGILGITALLIAYNRKHWLEIAALGAGGVALTLGKNLSTVSK